MRKIVRFFLHPLVLYVSAVILVPTGTIALVAHVIATEFHEEQFVETLQSLTSKKKAPTHNYTKRDLALLDSPMTNVASMKTRPQTFDNIYHFVEFVAAGNPNQPALVTLKFVTNDETNEEEIVLVVCVPAIKLVGNETYFYCSNNAEVTPILLTLAPQREPISTEPMADLNR